MGLDSPLQGLVGEEFAPAYIFTNPYESTAPRRVCPPFIRSTATDQPTQPVPPGLCREKTQIRMALAALAPDRRLPGDKPSEDDAEAMGPLGLSAFSIPEPPALGRGSCRGRRANAKTRMCRFARSGKCQQGENCTFAHSKAELRTSPACQREQSTHLTSVVAALAPLFLRPADDGSCQL